MEKKSKKEDDSLCWLFAFSLAVFEDVSLRPSAICREWFMKIGSLGRAFILFVYLVIHIIKFYA